MKRRTFIAGLGSAAAWPVVARAQQQTKPTVIWFDLRPGLAPPEPAAEAFRRGLAQVGFSEGRDVTIEYHTAAGHLERLRRSCSATLFHRSSISGLAGCARSQ